MRPSPGTKWKRRWLSVFLAAGIAALLALLARDIWLSKAQRVVDLSAHSSMPTVGRVHFAGPPEPPGQLRDLLIAKVRSARRGSSIRVATYYFVDRPLAQALMEASDRGVDVTLVLEGDPRHDGANDPVIALLKRHGLGNGLTIHSRPFGSLHTKIYIFSDPRPLALVGSFNPSGGPTATPALLDDIGDQDRGHNLLVEITSPRLVQVLANYVDRLAEGEARTRLSPAQNWIYRDRDTQLYFYPRLLPNPIEAEIRRLRRGDKLWAASSHLGSSFVAPLREAARRGVKVSLIVHHTERRVPQETVVALQNAGVSVRRYVHSGDLPMHAKFVLMQRGDERVSYFGSFNLNRSSRYFNEELLVRSEHPLLFAALLKRFRQIEQELVDEGAQARQRESSRAKLSANRSGSIATSSSPIRSNGFSS